MTIWVYTGDRPSHSAAALAKFPGFRRYRTGKYLKQGDVIINWGVSSYASFYGLPILPKFLNTTLAVKVATNKLTAFQAMYEKVQCVPWTVDQPTVDKWHADGATIIGRTKLTGHSGDGIIIMEKGEPIQPALLYTKYIFKSKEYRVHVINGTVIDTQRKIRDPDRVPTSWKVRSHANGFIFARNNIQPDPTRDTMAIAACGALGLDFGAVDLVEDKHGILYVLEVNTAPGLEGQTLESYRKAFTNG